MTDSQRSPLIWWKPDLARAIGRTPKQIDNWIIAGKFPPPDIQIGSRKGWTGRLVHDALRIASHSL
jgi:hypothetical protein